jgi:hypothetical protein
MIGFLADDEPLPRRRPVEDRNAATMALIKSFKVGNKFFFESFDCIKIFFFL